MLRRLFFIGLLLALLALSGCGSQNNGQTISIVIPRGTAAELDRGINRGVVPSKIIGRVGDRLVIDNRDSADQHVGPFFVKEGQKLKYDLTRPGVYQGECTLSKTDKFTLTVKPDA